MQDTDIKLAIELLDNLIDIDDGFANTNIENDMYCGKNKYDLSGEYGVGWTTNTNKEFYFDLEDFELIRKYSWYEYINTETEYHSLRTIDNDTRKGILMSSLLGYKGCDHIDRNPLNNRRNNFRHATAQQNARNRSLMSNNTSGVTGVVWHKKRLVWAANICVNYKRIYLGEFKNKDDAIQARLRAEKEYFKEFAPQQHLYKKYDIS